MRLLGIFTGEKQNPLIEERLVGFYQAVARQEQTASWRVVAELVILLVRKFDKKDDWHERVVLFETILEFREGCDEEGRAIELFDTFKLGLTQGKPDNEENLLRAKLIIGLILRFAKGGGWYARAELLARDNFIAPCEKSQFTTWTKRGHLEWIINLFDGTNVEKHARIALDRSGSAAVG